MDGPIQNKLAHTQDIQVGNFLASNMHACYSALHTLMYLLKTRIFASKYHNFVSGRDSRKLYEEICSIMYLRK